MRLGKRRTSIVACYRCECHGYRSIGTCGRRGDRLARGGEICRYRCGAALINISKHEVGGSRSTAV